MVLETLKKLFSRELNKLKTEIELYSSESNIWKTEGQIKNSGGNLCLHLLGNLNTYIGAGLAQTNYVRQRDLEFSMQDIPKAVLLQQIDDTIETVLTGLDKLTESQLKDDFPVVIWESPTETEFTLVHLITHLNYHLGQINYHRRIIDKTN